MEPIFGYKGVNKDLCGRNGFQFEVGKTYEHEGEIECCKTGFHFCKELPFCFEHYQNNGENQFLKVEILGNVVSEDTSDKYVTNKMKIVSILSDDEINQLSTGLFISGCGTKIWYKNGIFHREDGPAIEYYDGEKNWYKNGLLHRIDGPAIEEPDGTNKWYQNGRLHRIDGPAIEEPDGTNKWYQNGRLHRKDGPAIEQSDILTFWYLDGIRYTDNTFSHVYNG